MNILCHQESQNIFKTCNCFISCLKQSLFIKCHSLEDRLSLSSSEEEEEEEEEGGEENVKEQQKQDEEEPISNLVEEEEVFVSEIISKYMELKSKRKSPLAMLRLENSRVGDLNQELSHVNDRCLIPRRCSSVTCLDDVISVKTRFKRFSSLDKIEFVEDNRQKSNIINEHMKCDDSRFGISRKVFSVPPLPKSPHDSWSWRKSGFY